MWRAGVGCLVVRRNSAHLPPKELHEFGVVIVRIQRHLQLMVFGPCVLVQHASRHNNNKSNNNNNSSEEQKQHQITTSTPRTSARVLSIQGVQILMQQAAFVLKLLHHFYALQLESLRKRKKREKRKKKKREKKKEKREREKNIEITRCHGHFRNVIDEHVDCFGGVELEQEQDFVADVGKESIPLDQIKRTALLQAQVDVQRLNWCSEPSHALSLSLSPCRAGRYNCTGPPVPG